MAQQAACWLVWPAIVALPLVLTTSELYKGVFPEQWYDNQPRDIWSEGVWPSPLGLSLGIGAVVVGQFFMLMYFCARRAGYLGSLTSVQKCGASETRKCPMADSFCASCRPYNLSEGLLTHLAQPEGFVMLGGYLIGTWMFGLMPKSYYSFEGGINWKHVVMQLLLQDGIQFGMHMLEHRFDTMVKTVTNDKVRTELYKASHKPHHRFYNPRLFDAFNGSPTDTFLMILVPLILTARLVNANVWSYMAFGSLYANWLTLIHAEYVHPWDFVFRALGLGTAADHHIHHKLQKYNFGHLFMYWDKLSGTYKNPAICPMFNSGV